MGMAADRNLQRNARNRADHAMMVRATPETLHPSNSGQFHKDGTVDRIELVFYFYT